MSRVKVVSRQSKEFFLLSDFPAEIIVEMYKKLESKAIKNLSLCCKFFYLVYVQHKILISSHITPFHRLYDEQEEMLEKIKEITKTENRVFVISSMGTGKTTVMVLLATQVFSEHRTLIIVPVKTMTTWISEFSRYTKNSKYSIKFDKANPKKSDVLVYHTTSCPKHKDFFDSQEVITHKIVITTPYYTQVNPQTSKIMDKFIKEGPLVLIDEAHLMGAKCFPIFEFAFKIIAFTANGTFSGEETAPDPWNCPVIEIKAKERDGERPTFSIVNCSGAFGLHLNNANINRDLHFITNGIGAGRRRGDWIPEFNPMKIREAVKRIVRKHKLNKVLVFLQARTEDLSNTKLFKHFKEDRSFDWSDYVFDSFKNTNLCALEKFLKAEKMIMFTTYYSCSEGVNFNMVGNVITFDFFCLGLEKARQVLGRITRRNNPHKRIKIFNVNVAIPTADALIALNFVAAKKIGMNLKGKKSRECVEKIVKILNELPKPIDAQCLTDEEIMLLFGVLGNSIPCVQTMRYKVPINLLLSLSNMH